MLIHKISIIKIRIFIKFFIVKKFKNIANFKYFYYNYRTADNAVSELL